MKQEEINCVCNCVAFIILIVLFLSPQIEAVHFRFKLYNVANQHVLLYKLVQYIIDMSLFVW